MRENDVVDEDGGQGISRRTLIKSGAVIGGTIWVAPVVESFASKAFAASGQNYCCVCAAPSVSGTGSLPNQGESDNHPPTVADCVAYCGGQSELYTEFIWCGPSTTVFSDGLVQGSSGYSNGFYGCYFATTQGNTVASGCTSGTITYSGGKVSSYVTTSTSHSGAFTIWNGSTTNPGYS